MSLIKLSLGAKIIEVFPPRESLVIESRLETGMSPTLFLQCNEQGYFKVVMADTTVVFRV
jgi:hypothetical protein